MNNKIIVINGKFPEEGPVSPNYFYGKYWGSYSEEVIGFHNGDGFGDPLGVFAINGDPSVYYEVSTTEAMDQIQHKHENYYRHGRQTT